MFTGIIEAQGRVEALHTHGTGKTFWISSPFTKELKPDQSVAHDGACLTIEEIIGNRYRVTAISETLRKTNLNSWEIGHQVNLERSLQVNGRLDGHFVQGHVDGTATCITRKDLNGSWEFTFELSGEFSSLVIEKGSICLNGISLTVFNVQKNSFSVAIIPYTYDHTNINNVHAGTMVNLEFDVIGKYVSRIAQINK